MAVVAGVDACRAGWVAVVLEDARYSRSCIAACFERALERLADAEVIGVDIPIGLPEDGPREADAAARAFVGPRRSSVFPTPSRAAIVQRTYQEARAVVPSLSAQSFAIGRKILEVEKHLDERVIEVHPEVSFAALASEPLRSGKRTWNGQMERLELLSGAGIELPPGLEAGEAPVDDILDAAIAAWSADRRAHGEAKTLPEDPPTQDGRIVAIWY